MFIEPCIPTACSSPPRGADWLHEAKFDGWRAQLIVTDGAVRVLSRNGNDLTRRMPTLAASLIAVAGDVVIDGELVLPREDGRCDFFGLNTALGDGRDHELLIWAFDLLHLKGEDLRHRPLIERKSILSDVIERASLSTLALSAAFDDGDALLRAAEKFAIEGVVSKRRSSAYRSGKCSSWVKTKTLSWRAANRDRWQAFIR